VNGEHGTVGDGEGDSVISHVLLLVDRLVDGRRKTDVTPLLLVRQMDRALAGGGHFVNYNSFILPRTEPGRRPGR